MEKYRKIIGYSVSIPCMLAILLLFGAVKNVLKRQKDLRNNLKIGKMSKK